MGGAQKKTTLDFPPGGLSTRLWARGTGPRRGSWSFTSPGVASAGAAAAAGFSLAGAAWGATGSTGAAAATWGTGAGAGAGAGAAGSEAAPTPMLSFGLLGCGALAGEVVQGSPAPKMPLEAPPDGTGFC